MTTSPRNASTNAQSPLMDGVPRADCSSRHGTVTASPLAQPEASEQAPTSITPQSESTAAMLRRGCNLRYPVINQLPIELLVAIFESCLETMPNDSFRRDATQLHRICAVCQLWRTVAEGAPVLWRWVSALDPLQHIDKALKLSRPMLITVFYDRDLEPLVSEEEFMAAVEPHAARWGQAGFSYGDWDGASMQVWESSRLSKLHTLDLSSSSVEYTRRISLGGEEGLPNLREASFDNIPIHLNPGQLPGLRSLNLSEYTDPENCFTLSQLLHLLRGTPHLEELRLVDMEIAVDAKSEEYFALPELTQLHLIRVNPDCLQQFLSLIRLPKFDEDRHEGDYELSEEALNDPESIPYYERNMDVLEFRDRAIKIFAGRFQFSAWAGIESSVVQPMGIVLERFAKELTSSEHVHADIEMTDRLGVTAIKPILDRLEQFPNFKSIHVTQSNGTTALLTVIRLLGRPKVHLDGDVWYCPHLEAISLRVQVLSVLELATACWARRSAAAGSGRPKEIQQLHIGPLVAELEDELEEGVESQLDHKVKQGLDYLQAVLGAGRLFWRSRPWTGGVNGDGSESSS